MGPHHRSAIATLVERPTRYVKLAHLPAQDSSTLQAALVTTLGELAPDASKHLDLGPGDRDGQTPRCHRGHRHQDLLLRRRKPLAARQQ